MPLLEREAELARLAAAELGTAVLLEGVPGIGKSALLRQASEARGAMQVLRAAGSELEGGLTFGVVRALLAPVVALEAGARAELLAGPATGAAPVLGLAEAPERDLSDPLYALFWLVANLTERGPVLVAIDDLQWLDEESARFVAYLVRRIEGLPILLVAAARAGEGGVAVQALRDAADVIALQPLSAAAAQVLAGDADAHELTGGNPLLLAELRRARERAEPGTPLENLDVSSVTRIVRRRAERLSADALALAHAVSLFGNGAELPDAAAAAELDLARAADAADKLVEAGVLATDGARIGFEHPLMRRALYDDLGVFARRRGHALAAAALRARGAPAEQIAAHVLAAEPAGDAENVRVLRAAAQSAIAAAAPRAAIRYLDRAIGEGAAAPPLQRRLLIDLGHWQRLVGDPRAQATLARAHEAGRGAPEAAEAALEFAAAAFLNSDFAVVRRTVDEMLGADVAPDERLVLEMLLAETAWTEGDFEGSMRLIDRLPQDLPGDTPAQRTALAMGAAVRFLRGEAHADVLDMLRRSLGPGGTAPAALAGLDLGDPLSWMVQAEALDEAQALAEERMEHARANGDESLFAWTQNSYGWIHAQRGELAESVAAFRLGLAQPAIAPFTREHLSMNLSETLIMRGELAAALELVAGTTTTAGSAALFAQARRGEVAAWRGDYERALPLLEPMHKGAPTSWHPNSVPMLADYADALARCGRHEEAVALTEAVVKRSDALGVPFGRGVHRTTLGRLTGDTGMLAQAVEILAQTPYRWHEARARLDVGRLLRQSKQRVQAREHLKLALDYADRRGAAILAERARDELRLAGARPRRAVLSGADSLTPGEARIARLAAQGRSNKDIAQHLFLTVKTVEMTLSRAYRKLDVTSRRELPAALEGHIQ